MHVFPITKNSDEYDENINEILGYQVLDSKGVILAKAETKEEALESALAIAYLAESNEDTSKKVTLGHKMFSQKMLAKTK